MGKSMLERQPMGRPKVLLLGISYPSVENHMEKHGFDPDVLDNKDASVEQSIECVRRGILTEMDARDLARCVATEKACNVDAYSASKEIGAVYRDDRHIYGNFNSRNFCKALKKAFGDDIQFSQVILDYYWMPTGWLVTRWAKTLFSQTLPDLVRLNLLTYPSTRRRKNKRSNKAGQIDEGVVYLPFCAHVCKELVGAIDTLSKYYAITFVSKSELGKHALWKGTMAIDGETMQHRLGKRLDQEEFYCTFKKTDIYESMEDSHVSKSSVMRILEAIEDYDNIRMIRLRPLRQHEPPSVMRERLIKPELGGFFGLNFELAAERKRIKELESKRRKKEQEKQQQLEIKKKEKEKLAVKLAAKLAAKKKTIEKKKKGQSQREERMRNHALKKLKVEQLAKQRKAEKLFEEDDDEESSSEEKPRTMLFYPGPVHDVGTYEDPETFHCDSETESEQEVDESPVKRTRKRRKRWQSSKAEAGVHTFEEHVMPDYLAHNPRIPRESMELEPKTTRTAKDMVLVSYIPPREKELEAACKLVCLKDRGFEKVCSRVYGRRKELTCIKIPEKEICGLRDLSSCERVQIDRWNARVARGIQWAAFEGNFDFILLGRYETFKNIISWLRHERHSMFDPSSKFSQMYEMLGLSEDDGVFEAAEAIEERIHTITSITVKVPDLEVADPECFDFALCSDILAWLRDNQDEKDPTGEFRAMKQKLSCKDNREIHNFATNEALATEMTWRITIVRELDNEWLSRCVKGKGSPSAPHKSKAATQQKTPPKKKTVKSKASRKATRKYTRASDVDRKKQSPKTVINAVFNIVATPESTATAPVRPAPVRARTRRQDLVQAFPPSLGIANANVQAAPSSANPMSPGMGRQNPQITANFSSPRRAIIPEHVIMSPGFQSARTELQSSCNFTQDELLSFTINASSSIGFDRTRDLLRILLYLSNPHTSLDSTLEFGFINSLLNNESIPMVQRGIIMEEVLNLLKERNGEGWFQNWRITGRPYGSMVSEVLEAVDQMRLVQEQASSLKDLLRSIAAYPHALQGQINHPPPSASAHGFQGMSG